MGAAFDNAPIAQDQYLIRILHGGKAVGDHHDGFVSGQRFKGLLDQRFVFGIGKGGGLMFIYTNP